MGMYVLLGQITKQLQKRTQRGEKFCRSFRFPKMKQNFVDEGISQTSVLKPYQNITNH